MKYATLFFLFGLTAAFAQSSADFERSVKAAMAPALAQQRASIQRQVAATAKTASSSGSFFSAANGNAIAGTLADCDPLPADQLDPLVNEASRKEQVSPELVRAVIDKESAARPCAVSYQGAEGLMQLMPATAEEFDVTDPFDPKQNIDAGTKFLRLLLNRYGNDVALALGAYNAGPARVDQEGGIPSIPETISYVGDILRKLHLDQGKTATGEDRPNQ